MSEETPPPSSNTPSGYPPREKSAASAVESDANIESFDTEAPSTESHPSTPDTTPPDVSFADDQTTIVGDAAPRLEVIGDFEIHDKLGQGGMGSVYRARQISLDRWVALKILPASLEADDTFVTRFQREARIAASLSHRNLVRVYSSGLADGCHYIAMELVEGETLGQWLKRGGALPPPEALRVCLDVARALEAGWQNAHLIHRDIKPGNIFLSHEGEVKVGDLGLAKSMSSDTTGLTHTGTAMGTPHYISPEQARGDKDLDFRADIYSLGCTLFQMLTGRTPYEGRDPVSVMHQHIHAPVPAILKVLPQCPIPLARLVGKMLKKIKRERQASYEELIAQIESVQALFAPAESPLESTLPPDPDATLLETPGAFATPRSATPVTAPVVRATAAPAKKKSPAALYAGIGVGALVIGLAAFFLTSGKDSSSKSSVSGKSAAAAPTPASVRWTNLIDLVDPARDGINGTWKIENGELISAKAAPWSLCVLPVNDTPKNFDLRYRVTRGEGAGIGMFFPFRRDDETGGDVIFDYGSPNVPKWGGIEKFGDRRLTDTGTKRDMWLPKGQENTILVQVRDEGVAVQLNGEEVFRRTGDWSQIRQRGGVEDELFRKLGNRVVFGVGLFNSQASYHAIEMREVSGETARALPPAPQAPATTAAPNPDAEHWQNVLISDGQTLNVTAGASFTSEGLRLGNGSSVTIRATASKNQRNGAVRERFTFDGSRPLLNARSSEKGVYNLGFTNAGSLLLTRHESGKTTSLKEFALPAPVTRGETYELELRAVGSTLTAKFQGSVLGSVEDSALPTGAFGFSNRAPNSPEALLKAIEFLDLDAQDSQAGATAEWKTIFSKDSPPPPGSNNSVEFRDGLLAVGRGSVLVPQPSANAAIRARVRITEDTGYPALILRSTGPDYYKFGIGRDRRTLGMTHFSGSDKYDVLGRQEIDQLPSGSTVELEFRIAGSEIVAMLNGRQVFTATDSNLTAPGKWGISADAMASFESVEGRSLPSASATAAGSENWQNVLRNDGQILSLSPEARITAEGLRLGKNAGATVQATKNRAQRNGALRTRFTFDGAPPMLVVRSTSSSTYNLEFMTPTTLTLTRHDRGRPTSLKTFNLSEPLTSGKSYEVELRVTGSTLTAKFQGTVLGSAEDNDISEGSFRVGNYAPQDAPEVLLQSLEFLDLDSPGPATSATSTSPTTTSTTAGTSKTMRFWTAAAQIPTTPGVSWEDNALRVQGAPASSFGRPIDGAGVNCEVRSDPSGGSIQLTLREAVTGENPKRYYTLQWDVPSKKLKLQQSTSGAESRILREWTLPDSARAGNWLNLGVDAQGGEISVSAEGKVLGKVSDTTISKFDGFTLWASPSAHFRNIDFTIHEGLAKESNATAMANAGQTWKNLLANPGGLQKVRGAEVAPEGLKLPTGSYVQTGFPASVQNGAIRMKTVFGDPRLQLRARATSNGGYNLYVTPDGKTVTFMRWDRASNKTNDLRKFPLPQPLQTGSAMELELDAVGANFTVKLNGTTLGTINDPNYGEGNFGVGNAPTDSQEALVTALDFMEL